MIDSLVPGFEHPENALSFPQRKEAKENKRQKSIGNRTVAEGSTHISKVNSIKHNNTSQLSIDSRQEQGTRRRSAAMKNAEIDEFIRTLIMEGIVDSNYTAWVAKCIHTLGLITVNDMVINARNGDNPQKLLSFKLNGALRIYHKRKFDSLS